MMEKSFVEEVERDAEGLVSAFIFTGWDEQPFKLYVTTVPAGETIIIQPVVRDAVMAEEGLEINDGLLHLDSARAEWLKGQLESFLTTGRLME
jgi:hypothetical protein